TMAKRKRSVLDLKQKLQILEDLERGEKAIDVAQRYKIGNSTICDIHKVGDKLQNFATAMGSSVQVEKRKTMHVNHDEALDKAVYMWFVQNHIKCTPISGPMFKEKAKHLHRDLNSEEIGFTASDGWLNWFKHQHGICQLNITGEIMNTCNELMEIMETEVLTDQQIYNADETWVLLAPTPRALCPRFQKEHLTILACTNATGEHKLPLLVIGKSANPRYFKHINLASLPVLYRAQRRAWMNSEIFCAWFVENFIPDVRCFLRSKGLSIRALLLIDNTGTHPGAESLKTADWSIRCEVLPDNTTAKIQPMDKRVLATLKRIYRGKLLSYVLNEENDELSLSDIIKSISIKDAIYMLAEFWKDIQTSTIKKCWVKHYTTPFILQNMQLLFIYTGLRHKTLIEDTITQEIQGTDSELSAADVAEWFEIDRGLPVINELANEQIVHKAMENVAESDPELEWESDTGEELISHSEAVDSFQKCLVYMEHQSDTDSIQLIQLQPMLAAAQCKFESNMKQKS
uniref:HTH CENPB-type domain-containing protein n=1 Tax=Latimeria chalumnae TaxID=7897 RepID=H3A5Z0_LATCH